MEPIRRNAANRREPTQASVQRFPADTAYGFRPENTTDRPYPISSSVPQTIAPEGRRQLMQLRQAIHRECVLSGAIERILTDPYLSRAKRLIDIFCSGILIAVLAPVFLVIAIAIRLDSPGPALFKQERTGFLGRRFFLYKFRTMVQDAEQLKPQLMHLNMHAKDSPDFKIKDDPRITKIGRILRKTSLDELPNLLSVLRGDMAVVGPRPTSFHAATYRPAHLRRLAIRPGITGTWQVSGRADVDFDARTELDVEYINGASFLLDLKLMALTLVRLRRGAY